MNAVTLLLAALTILATIIVIQALHGTLLHGLTHALGNRDGGAPYEGLAGRIERTRINTLENVALFVPLILAALATDTWNATLEWGGITFVTARAAYIGAYLAGVPGLRTAVWAVGFMGIGITAWGLV